MNNRTKTSNLLLSQVARLADLDTSGRSETSMKMGWASPLLKKKNLYNVQRGEMQDSHSLRFSWALESDRFFSLTWQLLGNLHFLSACCCWCPQAWVWPVMTRDTAAQSAVTMGTLQAQARTLRQDMTQVGTLNTGVVVMKTSPSPLYPLWAGSGTMSRPRTWWLSGSWSAGFANLVSPYTLSQSSTGRPNTAQSPSLLQTWLITPAYNVRGGLCTDLDEIGLESQWRWIETLNHGLETHSGFWLALGDARVTASHSLQTA